MTYLVDTDYVVEWLKGRPKAVTILQTLAPSGLAISIITYGEIYEGIYNGVDPKQQEHSFRQFLKGIDVLPLNKSIMKQFAQIRGDLRRKGTLIGDPDILIGATALYHNLTIVTYNTRDFGRIQNLSFYQP